MAGHTYVTKAYNYNDFPPAQYGPEQHTNWYVVERRTVEHVRVPSSEYTKWGEPLEMSYESDYKNSSPPRYHEGGNLMSNFRNKLQIGATPHVKTNNLSSPNKYGPNSPSKYSPKSPNIYQPTSPKEYYSTSPIKYHPTSPNKHESTSPNKYRYTKPLTIYQSTSPNKYHPTSPTKYKSPNTHRPTSPDKYFPSSPNKYQPTSPTKYRPTSSTYAYPSKEANTMKAQNLQRPTKYRPTSPTKYLPTSPTHTYPSTEDHMNWSQDLPGPNKYRPTSPDYRLPSKEGQPIKSQIMSGSNKDHSSSLGAKGGQVVDFSRPKNHWQSAGPPSTRHPLMTPTNNINEALGFLMESYSPRSHSTREGSFDNLSPRAPPTEHEKRYARTANGGVTNRPYLRSNMIDSDEAVRRYNGAYVP